ncbi:MAG: ankyrin repeat domain-containing protein [Alphaproteobacteria bacterium]|nr:ankyrin repeat domain-containing protein [Alphaproteobacteria bacterium]
MMKRMVIAAMLATPLAAPLAAMTLSAATAQTADLLDAMERGNQQDFRTMLNEGADPDSTRDRLSFTPLALAAVRGETEFVRALLEAGADADGPVAMGLTPLAVAVRSCRVDPQIVRMLVAAGADINAPSGAGLSPVQAAIQAGRNDIAALLIDLGADIQAVNLYGDGVLNYAIYYEAPDIIQLALRKRVRTEQLSVLFTTSRYYQINFGAQGLPARRNLCGSATRN